MLSFNPIEYNIYMRIGIDVSQLAHEGTGVARYLSALVEHLLRIDTENEYILFYSSLRKKFRVSRFNFSSKQHNLTIKIYRIPPTVLAILWNKLHIAPIEWFIGNVDVFISSDWTEPPVQKAKKATILYDLIVYKYPQETDAKIISIQKKKLSWAKRECIIFFCISEATKKDAMEILGIEEGRLKVMYPGINDE